MRNPLRRVSFSLCFDGFRTAAVGAKAPTRSDTLEILICVNVYERKAEDSVTALQSAEFESSRKFRKCLLV